MHKKTAKNHRPISKWSGGKQNSAKMTVLQRRACKEETSIRSVSVNKSQPSSSWDHQTEQGSWSEDIEDVASQKILEHWNIVERTLFDEEDQLPPGPLFDECLQWRNQLPHLRIVGTGILNLKNGERKSHNASSKASSAVRRRERSALLNDKGDDHQLFTFEREIFSKEQSILSSNQQTYQQTKDEVLDHIVEFICKELAEIEAEKEADELSDNFDEFMKITPAPTCTGKNPLVGNNFYYNVENSDVPAKKIEEKKESNKEVSQKGRNKLGTVFNERIIVSPVPFITTSRQSFSTLRKTPILYVGQNHNVLNNNNSSELRREDTRRKLSLTRKTPLISAPHLQTSWNTPVCPTIWPKNVKLTPIDTSRLPSSKRRPSKTADSAPFRRNRRSLSPISRSVQPTSPRCCNRNTNHYEDLEIRGCHIVPILADKKVNKTKPIHVKRVEGQ